ncbi:MAG: HAMP domain-containing sensor histidine kinase [Pseudomonadota bacterium]
MRTIAIMIMAAAVQLWLAFVAFADESLIVRESYWVDKGRSVSLAQAQRASFTEFEGSIAQGYVPHALWIKLTIAGQSDGGKLAIVVRPMFLRQVELYDPELNGVAAPPILSGRDVPLAEINHIGLENGFIVPSLTRSRDVFLRILTTTTLTADIAVEPLEVAEYNSVVNAGLVAVYFAFILGFCLWSLVAWGLRRDHLYGLFALRQLYSLAHLFIVYGSLRFFLSGSLGAETREIIYTVVGCTVASFAGFFDVRLISKFGGLRGLRRGIYVLQCMPAITLPLVALGQTQTALQLGSLTAALQMLAMSAFAFSARAGSAKPFGRTLIVLLRGGFFVMAVVVVVPQLMYQNVLQSSVPLFKIVFLHTLISTITLFAVLSVRSRQRDLLAKEALHLVKVKEAELRQETSRRIEKERFLSMLMHELRNPLSVIELLAVTDPASAVTMRKAVRDMADVIDRVEQSERLDSGRMQVAKTAFDLSALLRRVAEKHTAHDRLAIDCPSPQMVVSDAGLLKLIVENLLDNAAKYSRSGSEIQMALTSQVVAGQEKVQFRIVNEIGIAGPPDPERLFTKYYRAKGAHRQPGSGLGLFLVSSWVHAFGGTITYTQDNLPNEAQQAIFTVLVPR